MILARFAAWPGCATGIFSFASVLSVTLLTMLYTSATNAYAGRPMAIDDATVTNAKGCVLETWMQKSGTDTEYWALPNCSVSDNLQLTLGTVRITGDDPARTAVFMQAKTLLKPLETNGWGVGLSVANQYDAEKSIAGDLIINVPVSFSFQDDRLLAHVNSGLLHKGDGERDVATWGIGSEMRLSERTGFTSEVCRQDVGKPFFQVGIRHQLIPDRMQIDASYGDRLRGGGSADRFFSIGIVLSADAVIP
jgi:hypothetical protein